MEEYIFKQNRNTIETINCSNDNHQVYQIALNLEEKIKMGCVIPDYELYNKHIIKFGDIVLKYYKKDIGDRIFEIDYEINEITYDDTVGAYKVKITPNKQCMGSFGLFDEQTDGHIFDIESIFIKNKDNNGFSSIPIKEHNGITTDMVRNNECHKYQEFRTNQCYLSDKNCDYIYFYLDYFPEEEILREKIHLYIKFKFAYTISTTKRGIFFSKKKNWYFIAVPNLDNVMVKRNKTLYTNGTRELYGIIHNNKSLGFYYGCNSPNGHCKCLKKHRGLYYFSDVCGKREFRWRRMILDIIVEKHLVLSYNGVEYYYDKNSNNSIIYQNRKKIKRNLGKNIDLRYYSNSGNYITVPYTEFLNKENYKVGEQVQAYTMNEEEITATIEDIKMPKTIIRTRKTENHHHTRKQYVNVIKVLNGRFSLYNYIWEIRYHDDLKIVKEISYHDDLKIVKKKFKRYLSYNEVVEKMNFFSKINKNFDENYKPKLI